ncbi:putative transcriptional regulator [Paenibacillus uliginis N3/975]|uniref:Putative transcriptional regulator n=1 Tax=Paenibacillus uliginis N3/975 TaxID=1313296 RepID=A0A1X7HMW1_9BACL|nr:helix-turn-helix transcriptional regulator [Paenibacillus uliginis]SMF89043.1 putative transcriptional regulator [Paenibacillus uliginis N3/975]
MLYLKLEEHMSEKRINTRQLSEMTGIRWNTVDDMVKNKSKHWSPENLEKVMLALEISSISDLIEYKKDPID